ncbi:hypothetical protein T440DRAFT_520037 [Plenodomus tracheiphilus IPT5]|uniref:Uncharacterized protein n=1 Tax=Plenodomus tracheiphilus IPT5 TaxID=1408161 RepID=A0A6A7AYK4_9PLEO|nr:hypothetical protein T440DRAFT_520037 [Plenodomus tracheiphilus IPT5]
MNHGHLGARVTVTEFISRYPDKAFDYLVRHFEDDPRVQAEINAYLSESGHFRGFEHSNIQKGQFATSPIDSHHHGSPPSRQKSSHRPSFGAAHPPFTSPLSPPGSASQASRTSSKGEASPRLYIKILTDTDTGVEEEMVRVRHAPIPHSVIHMAVVDRLNLNDNLAPIDRFQIPVLRSTAPGIHILVHVSDSISLTWIRPGSDMTHKTTFYVVTGELLDIDVLLGQEDSGEVPTGFTPNSALQTPRNPNQFSRGSSGNTHGFTQAPPAASWHRSATYMTGDDSSTTTIQHQPSQQHQQVPSFLQPMFNQQHPSQPLASSAAHPARPRTHIDTSRLTQSPAIPTASTHHTGDPNVATDRLRLCIEWGKTPIMVWIDLCASGDAFFQAFHKLAVQRKRTLERTETTLFLRQTKEGLDDEEYPMSLDEDELDADWEMTVDWLKDNKKEKPPHIYGRVEVGEG